MLLPPRVTPLVAQFFFASRQSRLARVTRIVDASVATLPPRVTALHLVVVIVVDDNDGASIHSLR
jgi:uncharacterized membrane protein YoaT (DUF817 family)